MADLQQVFEEAVKLNRQITQFLKFSTYPDYDDLSGLDGVSASDKMKENAFESGELPK